MPAEEQRSGGMRSGAHGGLMCPLEKGVRGIETSGSGYLRQQIRGGRKGRAERQGLGQSPNKTTRLGGLRQVIRCRAGAGEQGSLCGDSTCGSKKPPRGPGPPASQASPSSAEGGKSSRGQPCCQPHVAQPTNS